MTFLQYSDVQGAFFFLFIFILFYVPFVLLVASEAAKSFATRGQPRKRSARHALTQAAGLGEGRSAWSCKAVTRAVIVSGWSSLSLLRVSPPAARPSD